MSGENDYIKLPEEISTKKSKTKAKKSEDKIDKSEVSKVIDEVENYYKGVKKTVFDTLRKKLGVK